MSELLEMIQKHEAEVRRDHRLAEREAILKALNMGRDCFVTLFDCLAVDNRRVLEQQMREHAPGATIAWWFFENDVEKANLVYEFGNQQGRE